MENHLPVTHICLQVGDIQDFPWIAGHGVTHHWCSTGIHCQWDWEAASLPRLTKVLISQNCSCSNSSLPAMDQKPPHQGEECKSSKGTWVVWDLREENNIQHSLPLLFRLRHFLGKSIEAEVPKGPAAAVSCAKFALREVFLLPQLLK